MLNVTLEGHGPGFEVEFPLCHLIATRPSALRASCPTQAHGGERGGFLGGGCCFADGTCLRVPSVSSPQGNGHERDFMGDKRVYIMDVYNRHIYPGDRFAKRKPPPAPVLRAL